MQVKSVQCSPATVRLIQIRSRSGSDKVTCVSPSPPPQSIQQPRRVGLDSGVQLVPPAAGTSGGGRALYIYGAPAAIGGAANRRHCRAGQPRGASTTLSPASAALSALQRCPELLYATCCLAVFPVRDLLSRRVPFVVRPLLVCLFGARL